MVPFGVLGGADYDVDIIRRYALFIWRLELTFRPCASERVGVSYKRGSLHPLGRTAERVRFLFKPRQMSCFTTIVLSTRGTICFLPKFRRLFRIFVATVLTRDIVDRSDALLRIYIVPQVVPTRGTMYWDSASDLSLWRPVYYDSDRVEFSFDYDSDRVEFSFVYSSDYDSDRVEFSFVRLMAYRVRWRGRRIIPIFGDRPSCTENY